MTFFAHRYFLLSGHGFKLTYMLFGRTRHTEVSLLDQNITHGFDVFVSVV